jgi:hypothetical protein
MHRRPKHRNLEIVGHPGGTRLEDSFGGRERGIIARDQTHCRECCCRHVSRIERRQATHMQREPPGPASLDAPNASTNGEDPATRVANKNVVMNVELEVRLEARYPRAESAAGRSTIRVIQCSSRRAANRQSGRSCTSGSPGPLRKTTDSPSVQMLARPRAWTRPRRARRTSQRGTHVDL